LQLCACDIDPTCIGNREAAGLSRAVPIFRRGEACVIFAYTSMQATRVGIREFRENLASYIESSTPVAITRHGETVGFYVPARRKRHQADLDALRKAGEQLDALIAAAGVGEDELIDDFKNARRGPRTGKR